MIDLPAEQWQAKCLAVWHWEPGDQHNQKSTNNNTLNRLIFSIAYDVLSEFYAFVYIEIFYSLNETIMSKKHKKSRKPLSSSKNQSSSLSLEQQEKQTYSLLENEKYKEASESCKILLKHEKRPEWIELLAKIYHGRSRELASKGLYKEAVMICRNRSDLCHQPLSDIFYFQMLLAANMNTQALLLYQQHQTIFEQQGVLLEIRQHLAALSLTQPDEFLNELSPDDILIRDYSTAKQALHAYCDADDNTLNEHLAHIAFRSPFRDLRQILKAATSIENGVIVNIALLDRIPVNSPFKALGQAIANASLPTSQLFADFSQLSPNLIQIIAANRNNQQLLKLFNELRQLGTVPAAGAVLRLVIRHQKTLGINYAKHIALRILVEMPGGLSSFNKAFGKINPFELSRIKTWYLEKEQEHPMEIFEAWEENAKILKSDTFHSIEDYHLSLALIAHHKLKQLDYLGGYENSVINQLIQIIHFDPLDQASYIRLVSSCRQQGDLKQARVYLTQALEQFPDEISVLSEAVEMALASKAYKKVVQLANRILQKDPINTRVRIMLIDAHLSHTRKLLKQSKYKLAENELNLALNFSKTDEEKARIAFVHGTLLLDTAQIKFAAETWQAANKMFSNELCGYFYLLIELFYQKRNVKHILKTTKIQPKFKQVTKAQLLTFFNKLKIEFKQTNDPNVFAAVKMLEAVVGRALKHTYSISEFSLICEITIYFNLEKLTLKYVKKARKHYPEEINFECYEFQAKIELNGYISHKDMDRLQVLGEQAKEKDDTPLIHLIEMIMAPFSAGCYLNSEQDDEFDEPFNPNEMNLFIDEFLKTIPANELKKMGRDIGETNPRIIAMEYLAQTIPALMEENDIDKNFNPFEPASKKKKTNAKKQSTHDSQLELF